MTEVDGKNNEVQIIILFTSYSCPQTDLITKLYNDNDDVPPETARLRPILQLQTGETKNLVSNLNAKLTRFHLVILVCPFCMITWLFMC